MLHINSIYAIVFYNLARQATVNQIFEIYSSQVLFQLRSGDDKYERLSAKEMHEIIPVYERSFANFQFFKCQCGPAALSKRSKHPKHS